MADEIVSNSRLRAFSSPDFLISSSPTTTAPERPQDYSLEGISTSIKLLLKLVQDHSDAATRSNDDRKSQRLAGMMSILDDVKSRIEKHQWFNNRKKAAFRRCNTELRPNRATVDKKSTESSADDQEKLKKQLSTSLSARKSLEMMISSLGKEKEIMASELSRKVSELNELEELINDLKLQNDNLLTKLQACAKDHKDKRSNGSADVQSNVALQDRNKALTEQLLKSLDGYRYLKRKYKDAKEENAELNLTIQKIQMKVVAGLEQIRGLKEKMADGEGDLPVNVADEISALDNTFKCFNIKINAKN